jgi:hypothetical protein
MTEIDTTPDVTIDHLIRYVDELANIATPTPASSIVRIGLLTELRSELRPSLGSTGNGRGGTNKIPIDPKALAVWEDVTGRVQALAIDLGEEPARTGSVEQILNAWARDLVAADSASREVQAHRGLTPTGLGQDALRLLLHRLTAIRDTIDNHFNPPRIVEYPICPECHETQVLVDDSGQDVIHRAVTVTIWPHNPDRDPIAECAHCGATWTGLTRIEDLNTAIAALAEAHDQTTSKETPA